MSELEEGENMSNIDLIGRFLEFGKDDIIVEEDVDKIAIVESGDNLVRIDLPYVVVSKTEKRRQFDGNDDLYVREGVVERLYETRNFLPPSMSFKIFDAYRPLEFQQKLFDEEWQKVKIDNPTLGDEEIKRIVFFSVFPPNWDQSRPPPHSTGGALDLTLVYKNGEEIDMGSGYCEFGDRMYTNYRFLTPEQRANRVLLLSAMVKGGFANYPGEWWHYMYGEREYAAYMSKMYGEREYATYMSKITGRTMSAVYGRANLGGLKK